MKLTITGIIYIDGCIPFIGTAIDLTGRNLDVIFNKTLKDQPQIVLLDTIEATGEMMTLTHHAERPAFAINSMRTLRRETVGSVRRQLKAAERR